MYVAPDAASGDVKAAEAGIVTERDVLRAIARFGAAALDLPVGQIMSQPLAAVPADAFVYRAIGRMNRLKTRHLGVVDEAGRVVGALSARDLLRLRAGEAISLGEEIDDAADAHALAVAWAKLPRVAESLLAEGLIRPRHCGSDFPRTRCAHRAGRRDRRADHAGARPGRSRHAAMP